MKRIRTAKYAISAVLSLALISGCAGSPKPNPGPPKPAEPDRPAATAPQPQPPAGTQPVPEQDPPPQSPAAVEITVSGRPFRILTDRTTDPGRVLVAAGPQGFYWALPQAADQEDRPDIQPPTLPATIYYTPFTWQGAIDPFRSQIIWQMPAADIATSGAAPEGLALRGLQLHGPWLFYRFDSIAPDGAQAAGSSIPGTAPATYTALGVLDTRTPGLSARLLYRGLQTAGASLASVANEEYVVWQQGAAGALHLPAITHLYDLATGRQQALPVPVDGARSDLAMQGRILSYQTAGGAQTMALPAPGTDQLVPGATRLPSVAFGDLPDLRRMGYGGRVYLPAFVPPMPFYELSYTVAPDHYQVIFDGSDHPVPVNATPEERRRLGDDPPLAKMLGMVEAYTGDAPPEGARVAAADLPPGEPLTISAGGRTLDAHFVAQADRQLPMVWWREGNWRYAITSQSLIWTEPADPAMRQDLADVLKELPDRGALVPDALQGFVTVGVAADHRGTQVWFQLKDGWVHVGGYGFDALRGVQDLVAN